MADEWWSSTSHRNHGTSACWPAPLPTDRVTCGWASSPAAATESTSSITFQNPYRSATHQPVSDAASSIADPHMDWMQAFLSGRSDASFQAVLQDDLAARAHPTAEEAAMSNPLIRGMNDGFLLDQQAPSQQALFDAAVVHNISMYGDSQPSAGYDATVATQLSQMLKPSVVVPASTPMQGGAAQMQQYLSGSYLPLGGPLPSQLLLQALQPKPSSRNANTLMAKSNNSGLAPDSCSPATRKSVSESPAPAKRPRIEAPSPLPTFKVRKEKLGDRITALQQLVSPFGKTDTASVLHEAIEYIKFLHNQVASLSSPYLKNGIPFEQFQKKKGADDAKDNGDTKQDLRSRGLCLVPVANTYTVASETVPEFWHPTFGGIFR